MKSAQNVSNPEHLSIQAVILRIPSGTVASYGEIAHRAGLPGRARLVGLVLRDAGEQVELPWHRVIRADGRLAFAPGSKTFREQKRRLTAEGVTMSGLRVDIGRYGWQRDLDSELWSPDAWSITDPGKR